jgi:hypothetical protein
MQNKKCVWGWGVAAGKEDMLISSTDCFSGSGFSSPISCQIREHFTFPCFRLPPK